MLPKRMMSTAVHFCAGAMFLASAAALCLAENNQATAEPKAAGKSIQTSKEFKRLRSRAASPAEFLALATYCENRTTYYKADQTKNESELRTYYSKPHMNNYKFRQLDETLKIYIARDEKEIKRWSQLAEQFRQQARRIESPVRP